MPEREKFVQVCNARTGAREALLPTSAGIRSLAYSHDGRRLATGGQEGAVRVWELASRSTALSLEAEREVLRITFSPDGRNLAAATVRAVRVWALPSGREGRTLEGYDALPVRLMFSADGRWLASAWNWVWGLELPNRNSGPRFYRGEVIIWDTLTGEKRLVLPSAEGEQGVFDLCFSPDGTRLATAHGDGSVKVWSVKDLLGE
jgi:WD40 repeat protein